eukprot:638986-Pelagomonas_calceolata.AAC.1
MSSPSTTAPDFNSPACNGNIAYSNGNGALTPNGVHHATSASASSVTSSSSGGAGGGGEACSSGVVYEHGDHVAVYGQNAPAVVQVRGCGEVVHAAVCVYCVCVRACPHVQDGI